MPRPFIRAILIDLSGTLHIGNTPTPGAVEALHRLRHAASAPPFRFCSNTSKESGVALGGRLRGMGFEVRAESASCCGDVREVWTSVGAVRRRVEERGLKRYVTPYLVNGWR